MVARIAADLVDRIRALTVAERALEREITQRVRPLAPGLLALVGVGPLIAAKIVAEVADIRRFKQQGRLRPPQRHRPAAGVVRQPRTDTGSSRTGNRQLNAAIHRIAITQARCHPDARAYLERRDRTRQHRHRGPPSPQAPPLRRRLPSPPRRRFEAFLAEAA